ncbi:adenylyl cyclase [Cellulomonas sp. NTE-D12]|uniref:adenylyl cyclase n=1 Tax=Cellulomonas sp. NTE-D12 TaxID=2962632 RepID=UPI0030814842|nr:coagulation factor 5/8 type [Cellulomonas sp. NTE-D12]
MTFLGLALSTGLAAAPAVAADPHQGGSATDLGANVVVFTPSMSTADIRARAQAIYAQQSDSEMGTGRYALLFEPGTYGSASDPLDIPVGYYTEVAGLGQDPSAVTINGGVTAIGKNGSGSLDIFWRSVSNLTIHVVPTADGCHTGNEMWAVSQAAPMRRVDVKDYTTFMPYCENPNYASGGFVADSFLEGGALNGSQQQFYVRNTNLGGGWSNYVWNQVFSGDVNAPAQDFGNGAAYTTLATTPVSKEKPYLYTDTAGSWNVFVPSVQHDSVGTTWANGHTPGTSVPLNRFFVATPSDSVSTINAALARGLNLLLTPGVYDVSSPIKVKRAGTVVLGLGMATLTATHGNTVLTTADVPGIDIAGITVDAGAVNSPVLVQIGTKNGNNGRPHDGAADPVALQDVFFRIGGPHVGKAALALEVNTDHAVLDDLWVWRADHGVPGSVGWTVNTADTGLVVNGDDVTATGLFVEHFQKYNVIWNGNGGKVLFFQNELPYDPPTQADYQHDGILGYAAFKVADSVSTFTGYGMGSYIYTNVNPDIHVSHAFEVPVNDGVRLHDLLTINLSGPGTIDHVVNDTGGPVSDANKDVASQVVSFP